MTRRNIPILPDSTGRNIHLNHHIEIGYDQAQNGINTFLQGNIITGFTSGALGIINRVKVTDAVSGVLFVTLDDSSEDATFQDNEEIQIDGVTVANINGAQIDFYVQSASIVSFDNSERGLNLSKRNAAFVEFPNGSIDFDSFGKARFSQSNILGNYSFRYDGLDVIFSDETTNGSSISYDSNIRGMVLSCPTASGALVSRTSDLYHKYTPGISQLIQQTLYLSDNGKVNVRRRWGYFDDNNGLFFELNGTQLKFVIRSDSTGSIVDTEILQSNWNIDTFDGSKGPNNGSDFGLDLTKNNIFWIDFQWLGAGTVRFGLVINGQRLSAHAENNNNEYSFPYMRTASLPLRWEQENLSASGSTSEMRIICGDVQSENINLSRNLNNEGLLTSVSINKQITDQETYLFSLKTRDLVNGLQNHVNVLLNSVNYSALDINDGYSDAAIEIIAYGQQSLTSPVWQAVIGLFESSLEYDTDATHTGIFKTFARYVKGSGVLCLKEFTEYGGAAAIRPKANGTPTIYSVAAKALKPGSTVLLNLNLDWNEIRD